jgi:hypothetical protein
MQARAPSLKRGERLGSILIMDHLCPAGGQIAGGDLARALDAVNASMLLKEFGDRLTVIWK